MLNSLVWAQEAPYRHDRRMRGPSSALAPGHSYARAIAYSEIMAPACDAVHIGIVTTTRGRYLPQGKFPDLPGAVYVGA